MKIEDCIKIDEIVETFTPSEVASYLYRNYPNYSLNVSEYIEQYNYADSIEHLEAK